jgi:hypothetical protein
MNKMGWNIDSTETRATLNNDEILHILYHAANEPGTLQEAEKRQSRGRSIC